MIPSSPFNVADENLQVSPVEQLDLATVTKVSQAVSGQVVLEKLIDTIMRTAIEHAGAERGLLILSAAAELRVAAEATITGDAVQVELRDLPATAALLPETILHTVLRTRETVILDDTATQSQFADDPYIRKPAARSILCLPLINQAKLLGALYLENNLASRVFTPARTAVLKLLTSQAAMAIENTRLYRDLEEREVKFRRLIEANIIGIFLWETDGLIFDANDEFLRMMGCDRDDLAAGRLNWKDLTPPEWYEQDALYVRKRMRQPFEKEYFRKDGSRVPVLIGSARFDESKSEGIAFVLDLTERKRAEEALRRSEAYLAGAQKLSSTGSWARNANGEITHSSEEHNRLYGFDPELGAPSFEAFLERIHPEDRATVIETFERAMGERTDFEMDIRAALPDGTIKYIRGVGHPILDGAGNLVEYIGSAVDVTERKRGEQALVRSEKELRDVIETIPAMAWTTLPDGANDFANQKWAEFTGTSPKDTSDAGWKALFHPGDIAAHVEKWRASLASGEPFESEARIQRAGDGEYRWFLHRAVPLRDESGNIVKWYGISTEIDDRKRAEALLAGGKRILEMVAKGDSLVQILESLCRLVEDQAGGVLASISLLDGNRLRHGGAPSLPKSYTDANDGVLVGPAAGSCGTAAYRGEQVIVEDIATNPLWAESREAALSHSLRACWSTPIFSSRAQVIATFAMYYREPRRPSLRDQEAVEQITHLAGVAIEHKLTQEALRRSEAHLMEAQRLTKTGSWAYNPLTGETTYWSDEMFRIFGLDSHGNPSSDKFWQRVHLEDRHRVRERVVREAQERKEYVDHYRIVLSDGTVKHIQDIGHPVFDALGNLVEFVGTTVDVTEHKRAEEALRETQRELAHANRVVTMGQLTASIAHEVNQPIAATVTNAQSALRWLGARPAELEEVRQALDRIVKNGNRAGDVIGRIRALIKKAPPRKDDVAINEAILEVVALTHGEAMKNRVSVRTQLADSLPTIEGDRVQLQQVILNLIMNAIEAMSVTDDAPRELLLSTEKAELDAVHVAVQDSGPGLPPAALEHLFEAFHTTKANGMGLGLSICRSIIEGHGGRLWASPNVSRGAVFQFTVPVNPDLAFASAPTTEAFSDRPDHEQRPVPP